jgi:hypothetical protein
VTTTPRTFSGICAYLSVAAYDDLFGWDARAGGGLHSVGDLGGHGVPGDRDDALDEPVRGGGFREGRRPPGAAGQGALQNDDLATFELAA